MKTVINNLIAVVSLMVIFAGCTGTQISAQKFSNPDRDNPSTSGDNSNQAPKIKCAIQNDDNPAAGTRIISTILSEDTFFSDQPIEGQNLSFDCTLTEDETADDLLVMEYTMNYTDSNPIYTPITGSNFSLPVATPGRYPMAVRVSDGKKTSIKTFTMIVECLEQVAPVLDTSGVTTAAGARLNYFTYAINPGAVSGGTNFSFAWDFNGDYVYDQKSLASKNEIWTTLYSLSNIYTIFATESVPRKIGLKVRNSCELESYYQVDLDFEMPNIPRTAESQAEPKPYWYLQYDVSGLPSENQRVNGLALHTWYAADPIKRVECDYKKKRFADPAVFTIRALNWYKDPSGLGIIDPTNKFMHGMKMTVNNINDDLSVGTQTFDDAMVDVAQYHVSDADDSGYVQEIYEKEGACTVQVTIVRTIAASPCAADKTYDADFTSEAFQIFGEYNCPSLKNLSTGKNVSTENGKWFCEVAPANQCIGGGGGGGKPPPEQ